jgi:NAD(P)-dependent dehydrogenase (short-subunit alcohol dehydrogenase family)
MVSCQACCLRPLPPTPRLAALAEASTRQALRGASAADRGPGGPLGDPADGRPNGLCPWRHRCAGQQRRRLHTAPDPQVSYEQWQRAWSDTLAVNLIGAANVTWCTVRHMEGSGGGRIVKVASRGAFRGEPNQPAYGASKAVVTVLHAHSHAANRAFLSIISCIRPCRIEDVTASTLLRSAGCHRRHNGSAIAGLGALLAGLRSAGCHRRHNGSAIARSCRCPRRSWIGRLWS